MSLMYRALSVGCVVSAVTCTRLPAQVPGGTIVGTVVDTAGSPLSGVVVFLTGAEGSRTSTDGQGAFRLDRVPSGNHLLNLRRAGFAPGTLPLALEDELFEVGVVRLRAGPDPTAVLGGRITDGIRGRPVEGAEVVINGARLGVTDIDGRFRLTGVPVVWGPNRLQVRHLSFADTSSEFWIGELDESIDFPIALEPSPFALPGLDVVESPNPVVPAVLRGFTERRTSTNGYFLDRTEIVARNPGSVVALLRDVPGVRVRAQPEGTQILLSRRAATFSIANECRSPLIFVDGILVEGEMEQVPRIEGAPSFTDLDQFVSPDEMAGLEVYNGASTVPTIFNRLGSACGVVAIWTIRYALSSQALDAPAATASNAASPALVRSHRRRNIVIGVVVVPALVFGIKSLVCSLPHYCR